MMSNVTEFGFTFGSMEVERVCQDDKTGVSCIKVKTPKSQFSVRATKTGFIRIYDEQGNECDIVNKDYIDGLIADQIKYNKG